MALGERLIDGLVDDGLVHGILLRDRVRDEHAGLEAQVALRLEDGGQILRRVDARVNAEAALAGIERGQLIRAVAEHGHALRLQILQRQAEVEDGLCARAHDHDRRLRQLLKVGRDVHGRLGAAVHAADAAGGKDLNACHVGDHHRRGDGGGAVRAARADDRQVAAGDLGDLAPGLAEVGDLLLGQAGLQAAAEDGDGGGHGAVVAQGLLDEQGRLDVFRIGHAVGDDRALERDDRAAVRERLLHLGCDVQIFVHVHNQKPPWLCRSAWFAYIVKGFPKLSSTIHPQPFRPRSKGGCRSSLPKMHIQKITQPGPSESVREPAPDLPRNS